MVFKNLHVLALWRKVASALEGLRQEIVWTRTTGLASKLKEMSI